MFLFVYGPYMNTRYLEKREIAYSSARKAVLKNFRISFTTKTNDWKKAMIDIVNDETSEIEGVLYEIDDQSGKILDELEKVSLGKHRRIKVEVILGGGERVAADTFESCVKEGEFKPSKKY